MSLRRGQAILRNKNLRQANILGKGIFYPWYHLELLVFDDDKTVFKQFHYFVSL